MIDEVFCVMKHFPCSFINHLRELILSPKGNVYCIVMHCESKTDIICKLLEWCSRDMAYGTPYASKSKDWQWREDLLHGLNAYLGTAFSQGNMCLIYEKLGNAINHDLTVKFIESGYDLGLLRGKDKEGLTHE